MKQNEEILWNFNISFKILKIRAACPEYQAENGGYGYSNIPYPPILCAIMTHQEIIFSEIPILRSKSKKFVRWGGDEAQKVVGMGILKYPRPPFSAPFRSVFLGNWMKSIWGLKNLFRIIKILAVGWSSRGWGVWVFQNTLAPHRLRLLGGFPNLVKRKSHEIQIIYKNHEFHHMRWWVTINTD